VRYVVGMTALRIAVGALAAIGAFFVALQVCWLGHFEPAWLPYPAQLVGAAIAGLVMARSVPGFSIRHAFAGGGLSVALLATVSFLLPRAFTLTAARSDQAWLIVPLVAAGCSLACAGGAWLGLGERSRVATFVVAATVAACTMQLGGRVAYALGMPPETTHVVLVACVCAFVAGLLVQLVHDNKCVGVAAGGVAAFIALGIVWQLSKGHSLRAADVLNLLPVLVSACGAHIAWRSRAAA
jgi:hypothetical protein